MGNFAAQKIIIFLMDRFVKTLLFILYPIIAVCMAAATVIEKYKGTDFVSDNIYGSWWFSLLWALLLVCGIVWIVRRRMRRFPLLLVHGGFAVVLVGACVTHLTRWQGRASLRCGTEGSSVTVVEARERAASLPFRLPSASTALTSRPMQAATTPTTMCRGSLSPTLRVALTAT